jgi:hypothetical protein
MYLGIYLGIFLLFFHDKFVLQIELRRSELQSGNPFVDTESASLWVS